MARAKGPQGPERPHFPDWPRRRTEKNLTYAPKSYSMIVLYREQQLALERIAAADGKPDVGTWLFSLAEVCIEFFDEPGRPLDERAAWARAHRKPE